MHPWRKPLCAAKNPRNLARKLRKLTRYAGVPAAKNGPRTAQLRHAIGGSGAAVHAPRATVIRLRTKESGQRAQVLYTNKKARQNELASQYAQPWRSFMCGRNRPVQYQSQDRWP